MIRLLRWAGIGPGTELQRPVNRERHRLAETLFRWTAEEARDLLITLLQRPDITEATQERARQLLASPCCATQGCLPRFSYVTADGRLQRSEELRRKVVLLAFWA